MEKRFYSNHAGMESRFFCPAPCAALLHLGRRLRRTRLPGTQRNKPGLQPPTEGDFGAKQLLITGVVDAWLLSLLGQAVERCMPAMRQIEALHPRGFGRTAELPGPALVIRARIIALSIPVSRYAAGLHLDDAAHNGVARTIRVTLAQCLLIHPDIDYQQASGAVLLIVQRISSMLSRLAQLLAVRHRLLQAQGFCMGGNLQRHFTLIGRAIELQHQQCITVQLTTVTPHSLLVKLSE